MSFKHFLNYLKANFKTTGLDEALLKAHVR